MTTIKLQVCAGFANRLRATVSGITAARDMGCPIEIYWPYEPTFVGSFRDFFDVSESDVYDLVTFAPPSKESFPQRTCLSPDDWAIESKNRGHINIRSYGHFYQKNPSGWLQTLRSLKPLEVYRYTVDDVFDGYSKPVGVHIRRTDHVHSIRESPTKEFMKRMDAYPSDTMFFLATDSPIERDYIVARYPGRVLWLAKTLTRGTTAGCADGFLDFLGLSRCSEILGSYASSFSEMAAAYGGCPLTVVRSNPDELSQIVG